MMCGLLKEIKSILFHTLKMFKDIDVEGKSIKITPMEGLLD